MGQQLVNDGGGGGGGFSPTRDWYKCPLWHHKGDVSITEHLTADFLQREKPQLWRMDFSHLCRKQTPRESWTIGELLNEPVGLYISACASAHPRPSVLLTNEAPGHPAHTDISSTIRLVVIPDHFGRRRILLRSNFPYSLHNKLKREKSACIKVTSVRGLRVGRL